MNATLFITLGCLTLTTLPAPVGRSSAVALEAEAVVGTTCLFAGVEAKLPQTGIAGSAEWSLVASNRTLCQGTAEAAAAGPNEGPQATIVLTAPPLRPGVVLPAELQIDTTDAGQTKRQTRPVTIFSPEAFSTCRR